MKTKILLMVMTLWGCFFCASAQTDSLKHAYEGVNDLKAQINQQNQIIANLQTQVNEVLKQNLALKSSLVLKPTVAKAKTENGVVMKITSVNGDATNNTVTVDFMLENPTASDAQIWFGQSIDVYDENGEEHSFKPSGKAGNIGGSRLDFIQDVLPNTPIAGSMVISGVKPTTQYLKMIRIENYKNKFRFQNLPIKWSDGSEE